MRSFDFWQNGHRGTRLAIITPDSICIVAIEVGLCLSGRIGGDLGSATSGYASDRPSRLAMISAGGKKPTLHNQKSVCGDTHHCVMMKAPPTPHFVMTQAHIFQFFVIALNRPAPFGRIHQLAQARLLPESRKVVFRRHGFSLRPLNQQPFLRAWRFSQIILMRRSDTLGAKVGTHFAARSFAPDERVKTVAPPLISQLSRGDRLMHLIAAQ